ncbi:hypothetical protein AAG906_024108 [Vitis piasezkii]
MKVGKQLMKKYNLYWTSCAAHDLIFEDIGKRPSVIEVINNARKITNFIYNHGWLLAQMRKYCGGDIPIHLDDGWKSRSTIAAHAREFGVNVERVLSKKGGTDDGGDNGGGDIDERRHSQYPISQFTCENDFTHCTQDEDHGSRRAGPGIGAIGRPYRGRERMMEPYNEELLSGSFESMSIGTQFSDSSNEANVYPPHVMSYGQPSSSTDEKYGMSRYSPSRQIPYQVPYQMEEGFGVNTWVNFEYPIHVEAVGRTQEIYAWHVRIYNQYYRGSLTWYQYCLQQRSGFLHLSIPLNHIETHFGTKGTLQCNVYKLLLFNEMKYLM